MGETGTSSQSDLDLAEVCQCDCALADCEPGADLAADPAAAGEAGAAPVTHDAGAAAGLPADAAPHPRQAAAACRPQRPHPACPLAGKGVSH